MREQDSQRLLKLTSLVTFLFSDKKVTYACIYSANSSMLRFRMPFR